LLQRYVYITLKPVELLHLVRTIIGSDTVLVVFLFRRGFDLHDAQGRVSRA